MNRVRTYESLEDLSTLLYRNLGFSDVAPRAMHMSNSEDPLDVILPFIWNLQHQKDPAFTPNLLNAYKPIFAFFPISSALLKSVEKYIDKLKTQLEDRKIAETDNPVAYYMLKAHHMCGYGMIAIAARNLIIKRGHASIPPLLVATSSMPPLTKYFNLSPDDLLLSATTYKIRGNRHLADSTQQAYMMHLKPLLPELGKVYNALGYDNPALFLCPEIEELELEEKARRKCYRQKTTIHHFSSESVIDPNNIRQIILTHDSISIRSIDEFNDVVIRLLYTFVFHIGSYMEDLIRLKVDNYNSNAKLIRFDIKQDRLLGEDRVYIPLPPPLAAILDQTLAFRGEIEGSDPLFYTMTGDKEIER